jgi:hypothetical protein
MDGAIDLEQLPLLVRGEGVEIRAAETGELTTALVRLAAGHDARPLFEGLPGDLCQCPHWGYIIMGTLRVWTDGGSSALYRAGQAFYWPPGHAPEALEDTTFLEISPTRELAALHAHLAGK